MDITGRRSAGAGDGRSRTEEAKTGPGVLTTSVNEADGGVSEGDDAEGESSETENGSSGNCFDVQSAPR